MYKKEYKNIYAKKKKYIKRMKYIQKKKIKY